MHEQLEEVLKDVDKYKNLNLYLKALDEVKHVISKDYDFLQVVDGKLKTGVGKSTLAIFSAMYVDPTFTVERIAFADMKRILHVLRKAKPGQAVIIDEGGVLLFSRSWRTKENILFNKAIMISRAKRLFLQVVLPSVFYLDKYVRQSLHALVSLNKRGQAEYYAGAEIKRAWSPHIITFNPRHQNFTKTPQPAFVFQYPDLSKTELFQEYNKMKMEFIDNQLKEWEEDLEEDSEGINGGKNEEGMTIVDIMRRLNEHGMTVSESQLRRAITEAGVAPVGRRGYYKIYREQDFPLILAAVERKLELARKKKR